MKLISWLTCIILSIIGLSHSHVLIKAKPFQEERERGARNYKFTTSHLYLSLYKKTNIFYKRHKYKHKNPQVHIGCNSLLNNKIFATDPKRILLETTPPPTNEPRPHNSHKPYCCDLGILNICSSPLTSSTLKIHLLFTSIFLPSPPSLSDLML